MIRGYALTLSDGMPFSWHETAQDAIDRQKYEREAFGRYLLCVEASSVTWLPDEVTL